MPDCRSIHVRLCFRPRKSRAQPSHSRTGTPTAAATRPESKKASATYARSRSPSHVSGENQRKASAPEESSVVIVSIVFVCRSSSSDRANRRAPKWRTLQSGSPFFPRSSTNPPWVRSTNRAICFSFDFNIPYADAASITFLPHGPFPLIVASSQAEQLQYRENGRKEPPPDVSQNDFRPAFERSIPSFPHPERHVPPLLLSPYDTLPMIVSSSVYVLPPALYVTLTFLSKTPLSLASNVTSIVPVPPLRSGFFG